MDFQFIVGFGVIGLPVVPKVTLLGDLNSACAHIHTDVGHVGLKAKLKCFFSKPFFEPLYFSSFGRGTYI